MTSAQPKRPRDPRLDFFRGAAMLIILIAHIPGNGWLLWIPARFGFSDATEIFVFCSGLASSMAFGGVFAARGWLLGSARIAYRLWQVYWAHVGVFVATVAMLAAIDAGGWGLPDKSYFDEPYVRPFIEDPARGLPGLLTLRYTPGLFDILPMYLVILALVPAMVVVHRVGGTPAFVGLSIGLWLAASLGGWAHAAPDGVRGLAAALSSVGAAFSALNLPASPWDPAATWFFNPFAWQVVFFAGFGLGMGWLRPPPPSRGLILAALAYLVVSLPFAWFRLYAGLYLPEGSAVAAWLAQVRAAIDPLIWKGPIGGLRVLHFFALAYLAWAAVGPGGARLIAPEAPARPRGRIALAVGAAALALVTSPWAWLDPLGDHKPAIDWLPAVSYAALGWISLAHAAALVALIWWGLPEAWTRLAFERGVPRLVGVLRKVGTQSLAVFMLSIPLSQALGLLLDRIGRDPLGLAAANLLGVAILIVAAYLVGWFKGQPWRGSSRPAHDRRATSPAPAE
jgi:hypothetical protein